MANARFTLNVRMEVLKDAPEVRQEALTVDVGQPWASGVHTFYGIPFQADRARRTAGWTISRDVRAV